ncbi:uncharacterized protein PgNI_12321 [Pyricularia grisea]|uniref:DUF6604 domain-containing protein n=1 Tax=Pyricularia grisea TaxID=148305 RepID=A0A6P8AMX4_PYRGI|nr:uncharacterized protein PgNI_12321 [Pyricularia grisea]TLD03393.1 hypothetical protein PgNI_12321 [Pyricularia grisea]
MLNVAKRAIALHNNVTLWFLGWDRDAVDKRHAHFIQVLEEICELLSWETTPSSGSTSTAHPDKKPTGIVEDHDSSAPAWVNRLASLVVEDAEDELAASTTTSVVQLEVVENDAEEPDDDFLSQSFFRILCLLHDLSNWRRFLSDTWTEYSCSKVDLATAAVVTDTALQLARDLVQDVLEDLQHQFPVGGVGLQQLVVSVAAQRAGISLHPSLSQQGGLPYNEELADIAEFAFFPTGVLLQSFLAVLQNDNIPVYKPGYYGSYNAKADRPKMSVVEKFNEDKILLLELLPEYCVVANFGALLPVRDEITADFV